MTHPLPARLNTHTNSTDAPSCQDESVRVLVIPGLRDSGPTHWQSWLQTQYHGAVRVQQADWSAPELDVWAAQIHDVIARHPAKTSWIAVAHSFGCLALARHLRLHPPKPEGNFGIRAALFVAPADPLKFMASDALPQGRLGLSSTVVGSENDPWMPLSRAQEWAQRWGSVFQNLGEAGHINVDSGFGPWPLARFKVDQMIREHQRQRHRQATSPLHLALSA